MISWMQKHKKWLIITIWISTIAFIGAGFVGWGAYSYGDKAKAVAKVGDIEISIAEFQETYSRIYSQYAQMFQGNFDKEKAKMFGVDKQALQQLIQEALLLNLAKEYEIVISDEELTKAITSLPYFQTNGKFDKKLYKELLSQNHLKVKDFEEGMRKDLTIQKLLRLLPVKASKKEALVIDTTFNIADNLEYKVLNAQNIPVKVHEKELKKFWEAHKNDFMTQTEYHIAYVIQEPLVKSYSDKEIATYYHDNKLHFKDNDGKILPLEKAKNLVVQELNKKATKKEALKRYLALKKGKETAKQTATLTANQNPFNTEVFTKVSQAKPNSFLKPIALNNGYIIIQVQKITPSKPKSFEAAKNEVTPLYIASLKEKKLLELAKKSLQTFKGIRSGFITIKDNNKLKLLSENEAKQFLNKLFKKEQKRALVQIAPDKIVLYNILEQKLLTNTHKESEAIVTRVKQDIFQKSLLQTLQNRYDIEIYYKGL